MASNRSYCGLCKKDFLFKSKYDRHLLTSVHKNYARCLSRVPETEPADVCAVATVLTVPVSTDHEDQEALVDFTEIPAQSEIVECENPEASTLSNCVTEELATVNPEQAVVSAHLQVRTDDYAPFMSKSLAMAYLIVHSPRPIGVTNLKFIIHALRVSSPQVPSVSVLRKYKLPGYTAPILNHSSSGVPFYVNSIASILKMCIANPTISEHLVRYPVVPKGEFKELYHGLLWRTDPRFSPPMALSRCGNLYVGDFVQFSNGDTISVGHIRHFFCKEGNDCIFAELCVLDHHPANPDSYVLSDIMHASVEHIITVMPELQSWAVHVYNTSGGNLVEITSDEYATLARRNRMSSVGKPVVIVPITIFTDDTSGNKSKVWNKFDSWNFQLAGLPQKINSSHHNFHFICASNKVPVMEMAVPLVNELKLLEDTGIVAYDAKMQCEVVVFAPVLCFLCDNPRAAEICSQLGATSVKYCRVCMVNSTTGLIGIGPLRDKTTTLSQINHIKRAKTNAQKKVLRTEFGISDDPNPILELPLDAHKSTPVEALHTLLLGPYKYLLLGKMSQLSSMQRAELSARIAAFSFSGFDMKLSRDITKYFRSFVGRDLKIFAQIAIFILLPFLSPTEIQVWLALSKVFKIIYCDRFCPEKADLFRSTCEVFAHIIHCHCPELCKKFKIHLLLHITDDMLKFGPASSYNTERCESFNSAIRNRNIFANKQAPSLDICNSFAIQESIRFLCSGGVYGNAERCGTRLQQLYESSEVQEFVGSQSRSSCKRDIFEHGALRKKSTRQSKLSIALSSVKIFLVEIGDISLDTCNEHGYFLLLCPTVSLLSPVSGVGNAVMGSVSKLVNVGDFVYYVVNEGSSFDIGILLFCFECCGRAYCIVQHMEPSMLQDNVQNKNALECPLLSRTKILRIVPSTGIMRSISLVHECGTSCELREMSMTRTVERLSVSCNSQLFSHDWKNPEYCFNVYCMSNTV